MDCKKFLVWKWWFEGKKAIGSVSPGVVVTVLAMAGPPLETLSIILWLVINSKERLVLWRWGVAIVVVDVLVVQKNRLAIMSYQTNMPANSRECFYADNALKNSLTWSGIINLWYSVKNNLLVWIAIKSFDLDRHIWPNRSIALYPILRTKIFTFFLFNLFC